MKDHIIVGLDYSLIFLDSGIDFSGDATVGEARDYLNVFNKAKNAGLNLAIHMGEVRGLDDESVAILSLPPDRIGHGTFLHENQKCKEIIMQHRYLFQAHIVFYILHCMPISQ